MLKLKKGFRSWKKNSKEKGAVRMTERQQLNYQLLTS